MHGIFLRVDYADISLLGGREENQDRVAVAVTEHAALLVVVDGMGGHANGAKAAEVTQQVILDAFAQTAQPLFDPMGFLHLTLGRAHEEVVKLGAQLPIEPWCYGAVTIVTSSYCCARDSLPPTRRKRIPCVTSLSVVSAVIRSSRT
jgi:serine/threonine protein phosphatase PrpC